MQLISPGKQAEFVVLRDAQIATGGDVTNPHWMQPVDEAAGPFGPRQFQSP